ncbi:hypothetical protein TB1_029259 [Malus domestica]
MYFVSGNVLKREKKKKIRRHSTNPAQQQQNHSLPSTRPAAASHTTPAASIFLTLYTAHISPSPDTEETPIFRYEYLGN